MCRLALIQSDILPRHQSHVRHDAFSSRNTPYRIDSRDLIKFYQNEFARRLHDHETTMFVTVGMKRMKHEINDEMKTKVRSTLEIRSEVEEKMKEEKSDHTGKFRAISQS